VKQLNQGLFDDRGGGEKELDASMREERLCGEDERGKKIPEKAKKRKKRA